MKTLLVIATSNKGKVKDFEGILGSDSFEYQTLKDIGFSREIEENATTFRGNAVIKAKAVAAYLKEREIPAWVLADDSGLEVFALNNEPGVLSARYAGVHGNDDLNNQLLLKNLKGVTDRRARFVCALALLHSFKSQEPFLFEGECRGQIAEETKGTNGFGYDSLFIPEGYSETFGELSFGIKKSMSHRANAIKKLFENIGILKK